MPSRPSRRELLKICVLALTPGAAACGDGDVLPRHDDARSRRYFPQSVASGDPRPDSVVLWVRVEDASRADSDLPLTIDWSASADFTELLELRELEGDEQEHGEKAA